jgi:predicted ABC-type ATPase
MSKGLRFFIIAGPNGAGKTAFGSLFVPSNVSIFNGDLIFADLVRKYPHIDPEKLKGGVPSALEKARDQALSEQKDFAFETNFSANLTIQLAKQFQKEGYKIHLIYFGLKNIDFAKSRVRTRVGLGGHDVPTETIEFNYEEGIKLVKKNLRMFDTISFISNNLKPSLVAYYEKSPLKYTQLDKRVTWFNRHFKSVINEILLR